MNNPRAEAAANRTPRRPGGNPSWNGSRRATRWRVGAGTLALLATLLAGPGLAGPEPGPSPRPWQLPLDSWGLHDGLPGEAVTSLAQTPDGYLWVGTLDGLARFDGVRFEVYRPQERSGLRNGSIRSLAVDGSGTLWVGTGGGGVVSLEQGTFHPLPGSDGWMVRALLPTQDGLYVATESSGLQLSRDGKSPRPVRVPGFAPTTRVTALALDGAGRLWVGSGGDGVARREASGAWEHLLVKEPITNIRLDRGGRAWIATSGHGVFIVDGTRTRHLAGPEGPGADFVSGIAEDRDGSVWVGTAGAGVARFSEDRFQGYPRSLGFPLDVVAPVMVDAEGLVWAGGIGGLARLGTGCFVKVGRPDGLPGEYQHSAAQEPDGRIWAAGTAGLSSGDAFGFRPEALPTGPVLARSVAIGPNGTIWVGTHGPGVLERRAGRWIQYGRENGLPSETVRVVFVDSTGRPWAGTSSGLARLEGGAWVAVPDEAGGPLASTLALAEVPGEGIWAGTDGDGLKRVADGRAVRTVGGRDGLPSGVVLSLRAGSRGLWIGTNAGLARLREGKVEVWRATDGLPGDSIGQLAEVGEWLFVGTTAGVARIALAALDRGARPLPASSVRLFGREDGLTNPQCVAPSNGPLRATDGRLWFATTSGFAVLEPRGVKDGLGPPRVVIERVMADGEEVPLGPEVRVPAGTRRVEVSYTGLGMRVARVARFEYRLDGVDTGWVEAGPRRTAVYTGLPSGTTRFRVVGRSPGGASAEATLSIVRPPRTGETVLFRVGLALLVIGTMVVTARGWGAAERRRRARLEGLVSERTAELGEARTRAEKAALAWRQTFDAVDAVILLLAPDGIVLEINDAARRLGGPRATDAAGRRLSDVLPGEPWIELARLAREARPAEPHAVGLASDAAGRTWVASANLFGGDVPGGARVVVIAREITDLVRLQDSLRRSETLSAVGNLVAGVAHEVRNPLFAISANLEVFRSEFGGRAEYAELVAAIEPSVARLSRLMSELLDYSRPHTGAPAPVRIDDVLGEAVSECRSLADRRRVALEVRVAPGLAPVAADRDRLVQAFQNLVENAVEHSPEGGRVSVDAGPGEGDGVECRVEDQGPGLDPEALERAFEPFFTRRRGGTGLGLAIVQRILEQHGGKVEIRNGRTRGAIAVVRLGAALDAGDAGFLPM